MKRFYAVVILIFVITLSACGGSSGNALEKALDKMETADSYRMDVSMDGLPFFGSITIVTKVDGDLSYQSSIFGDAVYSKMVDGLEYEYVLNANDELVLSTTPEEVDTDEDEEDDDFLSEIQAEDFKQDAENTLVWTFDGDNLYMNDEETEYMTDIVITLDDTGNIDTMSFTMYTEDLSSNVVIAISGVNNTTITVPGN